MSSVAKEFLGNYVAGRRLLLTLQTTYDTNEIIVCVEQLVKEALDARKPVPAARLEVKDSLTKTPDLNFIVPRGKYSIVVLNDNIILRNAKQDITIPVSAISTVAIMDNIPKDTKGKILMFFALDKSANIMNGKTRLDSLLLQTLSTDNLTLTMPDGKEEQGIAAVVLSQLLGAMGMTSFTNPVEEFFLSSKKEAGVNAVIKVNDGMLFPLPDSFVFIERPATYIPHSNIAHVQFCRAGGGSTTFDLALTLVSGETIEFSQIDRTEIGALQNYVMKCRLKVFDPSTAAVGMAGAGGSGVGSGGAEDDDEDDDDSDESDEDFDPERDDHHEARRPSKRARTEEEVGGSGSAGPAGGEEEAEEEDDEHEGSDDEDSEEEEGSEDIELTDEEGIQADHIRNLMSED